MKYAEIPINTIFETTSGKCRKLDALYYEDLTSGYQSVWSPVFDLTILTEGGDDVVPAPAEVKFITDPQSRITTLNPNYGKPSETLVSEAEEVMGEMWGSAQFDCGREDFTYMGEQSVAAVRAMEELTSLVGLVGDSIVYPGVIDTLARAYIKYSAIKSTKKATKAPARKRK